MDNLNSMPPEVLLHLFSFLEPVDLMQTRAVCSEWKMLSKETCLWKPYFKQMSFPGSHQGISAYWHSKKAEQLLLKNEAPTLTLYGLSHIVQNYIVEGQELFLGNDKQIQIRNLENYQINATLESETGNISQIFLTQNQVVAFYRQNDLLNIWDRQTNHILYSLNLTTPHYISKIVVTEKQIVVSFTDCTIKIFNIKDGQLLHQLSFDEDEGNEFRLPTYGNELISTAGSSLLKFWDMDSGQLLKTEDVGAPIMNCKVSGDLLVASCENHTISIWDLPSKQWIATLNSQAPLSALLSIDGDHLITSTQDHCLQVWSLANKQLLHTLRGHDQEIREVAIRGNQLFASTESGSIYRWDLKHGSLLQEISGLKEDRVTLVKMALSADKIMASFMEDVEGREDDFIFHPQNNFRIWDLSNH
ncbi:MAG: fbxw7 [Chlamydiales bacterium]|jgi:WD40 repeat protein|nr:fbxw7 [Chlamydiales bacterium]